MIVDDHALFRDGISMVLNKIDGVSCVIEEATGSGAINTIQNDDDIDLILLDYQLGDTDGLSVLAQIKEHTPATPVIMLSAHEHTELIQQALQAGASGFITKTSTSNVMMSAIQLVLSGGIYVPPAILNAQIQPQVSPSNFMSPNSGSEESIPQKITQDRYQLTSRQTDVMQQMGKGLANKEIARILNMSPSTVKVHVAAILKELEVKNRTQAVSTARGYGLIE